MTNEVFHAPWASALHEPYPYKVTKGGRGGGKTLEYALAIIRKMKAGRIRVAVGREFKESTRESANVALRRAVEMWGWDDDFDCQETRIICKSTGAYLFYLGLSRNKSSMRSLESVDILWIEEGQSITGPVWETARPTVRKDYSEIWITINPTFSTDAIWKMFFTGNPPPGTFLHHVNFDENPFVPERTKADAAWDKEHQPDRYGHVWLGQLDDTADDERRVLPLHILDMTVQIPEYDWTVEPTRAGFDIADVGADDSYFVTRQGPVITNIIRLAGDIEDACARVYDLCEELDVDTVWFDAIGIGTGARDRFRKKMPCKNVIGVKSNNKINSPSQMFDNDMKNNEMFLRMNGQLGWNMHMRAEQTRRREIKKDDEVVVDPRTCLYILPDAMSDLAKVQLAQPIWKNSSSGHILVEKTWPGHNDSPDIYDASTMSFAYDVRNGLKSGARHLIQV